GVTDNRETRYTVTGATEAMVDLDAVNNVSGVATVEGMAPDGAGEITVALSPGPNNNNANHFTYLGVLRLDLSDGTSLLMDFGASGTPTDTEEPPPPTAWNNIVTAVGISDTGAVEGLVSTNGAVTGVGFQMIARFNGANTAGATTSAVYPSSATRDSLFGNTEAFSGLANVFPQFKLTGLDPAYEYTFTFYGSRTGVGDNRETRYTVTGAESAYGDLNTANNVDGTVTVAAVGPDAAGEITVALSPGPNNNNGNHFTYLGVMQVDTTPVRTPAVLVDFGAAATPTVFGAGDLENHWNNVSAAGMTDAGELTDLVMTDGTVTPLVFRMISRFNGVNEAGTTTSALYPSSATRDSLFGNVESFNGLENITPVFVLAGLTAGTAYDLTFYASRLGASDQRETRYTVTGGAEAVADLNASNNETGTATVTGMLPDAAGEIRVTLTPGPNNNNANHFTYLGVLRLDWTASVPAKPAELSEPQYANGMFSFLLTGTAGKNYVVQKTRDFAEWTEAAIVRLDSSSQRVEVAGGESGAWYRAIAP
ncbi:MAG TPA: hypothetical protein PKM73_01430, partial [Verrucomicrobiota bacterium]|nr:hypothetical protein [Verrucomicrobiota bacterium]